MSRIPLRTPSKRPPRDDPGPSEEAVLHNEARQLVKKEIVKAKPTPSTFKTPRRFVREAANDGQAAKHKPESETCSTGLSHDSACRTPNRISAKFRPETNARTLAKSQSTISLKEHIARARAQLKNPTLHDKAISNSGSARPRTANAGMQTDSKPDFLDIPEDDPFVNVKDPFGQARHQRRHDPRLLHAIDIGRTSGKLNISNLGIKTIPDLVLDMYKPDASHVIDFSQEQTTSWYDYEDLTSLNAADNELTALAAALLDMAGGLRTMILRSNCLSTLPHTIGLLSHLSLLDLSNNHLGASVLPVICQIESLSELNLAQNRLEGQLPSCMSNLTRLEVLDLSGNQISSFSSSLHGCTALKRLNLSGNKLTNFSLSHIAPCMHLEDLDASRNLLSHPVVDQTMTLAQLSGLNLSQNRLANLSSYGHLVTVPRLQMLRLTQNSLVNLQGLTGYNELLHLNIQGNQFSDIPGEVYQSLLALKQLDISDNQFEDIPSEIGLLPSLTQLLWQGNPARMRGCYDMSSEQILTFLRNRAQAKN